MSCISPRSNVQCMFEFTDTTGVHGRTRDGRLARAGRWLTGRMRLFSRHTASGRCVEEEELRLCVGVTVCSPPVSHRPPPRSDRSGAGGWGQRKERQLSLLLLLRTHDPHAHATAQRERTETHGEHDRAAKKESDFLAPNSSCPSTVSGSERRSAVEAIGRFINQSPGCSQGTILALVAAWQTLPVSGAVSALGPFGTNTRGT